MRHGGGFRFVAAVLLIGFIGLITAGAYGAGYAAGSDSNNMPPAPWAYGGAFGAGHLFGFIIALFVLFIVIRLMVAAFGGHPHRGWAGRGGWGHYGPGHFGPGPDDWHRSEWRQAGENAFDEWHRKSHERGGGSQTDQAQ